MITAQDVREKVFKPAKFNGYTVAEVDDFLEEIADEMDTIRKENAALKAKMKVLADSIQGYRANEEAVNLSILSAQKLAVQIESDARARAAALLEDANRQAAAKIGSIAEDADAEEKRLNSAKAASAKFLAEISEKLAAQVSAVEAIITGIGPVKEEEPAVTPIVAEPVEVDEAVRSIEDSVARIQPTPSFKLDLSDAMEAPAVNPASPLDSTQQFSF